MPSHRSCTCLSETNTVPDGFARTIVELYGTVGVEWLSRLPSIIDDCAQRWSLMVMPPFEPLSYNYVAPAVRADGTEVVLKVGWINWLRS
jgi:streptomycin 6-kinase